MNDLPRVGLQPAARPVDTFAAPEVRMGQGAADGRTLGELAQALSQFNGNLSTVADRWIGASNARANEQGIVDGATTKNQEAFKAAVARGDIKESDNPWYIEGIKQSWAQVQSRQAVQQFQVWYDSSPEAAPIRSADNPAEVDAAFDEKVGPILRTFDTHQIAAVLPELQQSKHSLTQNHLARRSQERVVEREQLYQNVQRSNVSAVSAGITALHDLEGDSHAEELLGTAAASVQATLDQAATSMDRSALLKNTVSALFDRAEHGADPRMARAIMDRVKSDGKTLTDLFEPQLDNHELRVSQLAAHRWTQQNAAQNQLLKNMTEGFLESTIQRPPSEWMAAINSAPLQLRTNLANVLNNYGKDVEGILSTSVESRVRDSVLNSLSKGTVPTQAEWMAPSGPFMLYTLVKNPKEYMGLLDQSKWPKETQPAVFLEVTDTVRKNNGVLPFEHLQGLIQAGKVSKSDADEWVKLSPGLNSKNPLTPFLGDIGRGDDIIQGLVVGGMLKSGDLDYKDSTTSAQVSAKMTQARFDYQTKAQAFVLANQGMDPQALAEGLTKIAEHSAQDASGISVAELRELNDTTKRSRRYAEFVNSNTPTSPADVVPHPSKPNTYTVKGYGVEVGYSELPMLFKNSYEFNDNVTRQSIFRRFGLTESKDQKRFLDLQLKRLKDAGLSK